MVIIRCIQQKQPTTGNIKILCLGLLSFSLTKTVKIFYVQAYKLVLFVIVLLFAN